MPSHPTKFTDGRTALIVKLIGCAIIFSCGALYSSAARRDALRELAETEGALTLFRYIKSEISDYSTPLDEIFASRQIFGGINGLLESLSENLQAELCEARKLGHGYGNEELRICDKLIARLEERKKRLESKAKEVTAISRVKGFGISAAVVILLI